MERIRRNRLGQAPCPKKSLGWKTAEGYEPWSEPLERASCCCAAPEETLLDERQRIESESQTRFSPPLASGPNRFSGPMMKMLRNLLTKAYLSFRFMHMISRMNWRSL
jgi:hypothetical protein